MVAHMSKVVTKYEERLRGMPFVPRFSYGRPMLREYGPATILYVIVVIFRLEEF
jgi:hypothetical protein